ncbi:MAG: immunoglobulin-like domain-containing protein [bacterium]
MKKVIKILLVITILFINSTVFASTNIHLEIETNSPTPVYNQDMPVIPCDSDGDISTPDTITAYCALIQSGITSDWSGLWINSIKGIINNDGDNGVYWMWMANLSTDPSGSYNLSAKQYILNENDRILFYYNTNPLDISIDNVKPEVGQSIKIIIKELGLDSNWNPIWNNAVGGKVTINSVSYDLNENGTYSYLVNNTDALSIKGQKTNFIDTSEITITPTTPQDIIPPVIVLNGEATESIYVGDTYTDKGATATDNIDGNITDKIATIGSVDTSKAATSIISFNVNDIAGNKALTVTRTVTTNNRPSVVSGSSYTPPTAPKTKFNLNKAILFIASQQKEDGSFGEELYTDWATLALASENNQSQIIKLVKYFGELKMTSTLLTDYERRAMTLMTLGLNPYNTNGENYIKKIIDSFDGKQFGDTNEENDDIFALIVLQNAGYTATDKIIADNITFILNRQKDNGSWNESIDMTGAAIEALSVFSPTRGVGESLAKAKEFLKQNQKNDGGWNNVSSTAWVMEGILALGEKPEDWIKNNNTPLDYLSSKQDTDGGIINKNEKNKLWETSYVASVLSGKTWNQIIQKFDKVKTLVANETPAGIKSQIRIKAQKPKNENKIITKNIDNINKIESSVIQNTATVINAQTEDSSTNTKTNISTRNWFMRILDSIFSIF